MASLYRPSYTRKRPDGTRESKQCKKWWGKWRDRDGREQRKALSRNKKAAQLMLADLVRAAEMGRAVADPYAAHRQRPLAEHLAEWQAELRAKGNTPKHVGTLLGRARRVIEGTGAVMIGDLSGSRVETWLARLRTDGVELPCGPRGGTRHVKASVQTSNHYLGAVQQFATWLVDDVRTDTNPLARLEGGNVDTDRRHVRRALTDAELGQLLGGLAARPTIRGLSGADRRLLYLTALYTGLRASELASLQPESFDLAAGTVTVAAGHSKHRRQDTLPLHPALLTELQTWLQGKPPAARLWPGKWALQYEAGLMLQADLEAAGVPYRTRAGVADFHALRHTYVTRVIRSGASTKEAQRLARHSDVRLTLDLYTHLELAEDRAALGRVPELPKEQKSDEAA